MLGNAASARGEPVEWLGDVLDELSLEIER